MSAVWLDEALPTCAPRVSRRCPVCDSGDGEGLFDNRMAPIAEIDFSYVVTCCRGCGMVYASHAPDEATMQTYYRDFSKYDQPRSTAEIGECDLDRAEVAAGFTARLLGKGARILDVGCSIGLYVAALERRGLFALGLDPSGRSADVANTLFGARVEVGDAYGFADYADFDGVALLAVLEHLGDPARLLAKLGDRMKPGATLIVEVPDADVFGEHPAIGSKSEPLGEFSNEHINFFGGSTLTRLAADAGFRFVASEPFRYTIGIRGLLAAYRKGGVPVESAFADDASLLSVRRYVAESLTALRSVERKLERVRASGSPVVLYGAGSHSARLLAQGVLAELPIEKVLDRNLHLTGRTIGAFAIGLPDELIRFPRSEVIVSTFNAMHPVIDHLRGRFPNRVLPLYDTSR